MPINDCKEDGKPGYKYGTTGKCYTYTAGNEASRKEAKRKAYLQGAAIKGRGEESMRMEDLINKGYVPMAFTSQGMRLIDIKDGVIQMSELTHETIEEREYDVVDAVVAVGNKFYGNIFVPADVLKTTAYKWDGTLNDLSHFGTMYPAGLGFTENLDYITGYNSDAHFDDALKAVRVKMHISHNSPKYKTWRNFIDVSRDAKRIPNVSIFGFSKFAFTNTKDLPSGMTIPKSAVNDDKVITMTDIVPFAITTCLQGKCNDKEGCGISSNTYDSKYYIYCDGTNCNIEMNESSSNDDEEDKEDEELKKSYKNRIKERENNDRGKDSG